MTIDDRDDKHRTSAVDRYASRRQKSPDDSDKPDDNTDPFFKLEKEMRGPAINLSILLKNGNKKTMPYHLLIEMDFDPETAGIEIYYSTGVKIIIRGMHLSFLYDAIAEQRVLELRSIDKLHAYNEHRKSDVTGLPLPLIEDIIIERGIIDVDTGVWKPASGTWNSQNQQWQPSGLLN